MNRQTPNHRRTMDHFLGDLGKPVSEDQLTEATGRILNRLALQYQGDVPQTTSTGHVIPIATGQRWIITGVAAAALLFGVIATWVFFSPKNVYGIAEAVDGEWRVIDGNASRVLNAGDRLAAGEVLRTGPGGGVLILTDDSRVELHAKAEVSLAPAEDGIEIRLATGSIIVTAAKQPVGHLYVKTKDCTVSVIGTVFSVSAVASGSRVSVIEGEVRVSVAQEEKKLLPGEQMRTGPGVSVVPVIEDINWSRNAAIHVAMLERSRLLSMPLQANARLGVLRGFVRNFESSAGISGAAITVCMASDRPEITLKLVTVMEELRILNQLLSQKSATVPAIEIRDQQGDLISSSSTPLVCKNPLTATTNPDGQFIVQNVPPGEYIVSARRDGYVGLPRKGRWQAEAKVEVQVTAEQVVPEITFQLAETGVIGGIVRDGRGQTLANATVQAFQVSMSERGTMLEAVVTRSTDDRGEYRLYGLPPGEYYVASNPPAAAAASGFGLRPQRTFYPGVLDASSATRITLRSGEEMPRTNIDQSFAFVVRLSGSVTGGSPGQTSASLVLVSREALQPQDSLVRRLGIVELTQGQGAFSVDGIVPGSYDLVASGPCSPAGTAGPAANDQELARAPERQAAGSSNCIGITSIDVRQADLDGVAITLLPRVDLAGRVALNGRTISGSDIRILLYGSKTAASARVDPFRASSDGTFIVEGIPPGHFVPEIKLLSSQLQDSYVSEIRQGGANVLTDGFEVGSRPLEPLEVLLGTDGGVLNGVVEESSRQRLAGAFVVLVPQGARRQNRALYPTAAADAEGRFTIRGIAPGDYKAFAWKHNPGEIYYFNPAAMNALDSFSRSLRVTPRSSTTNFQIAPVPEAAAVRAGR